MANEAKVNTAVIVAPGEPPRKALLEDHLGVYQEVVGGSIEGLSGRDFLMYINEDGNMLELPFNGPITMFARTRDLGATLVGTAVILGPIDGQGNPTSVRKSVLNYFGLEDQ